MWNLKFENELHNFLESKYSFTKSKSKVSEKEAPSDDAPFLLLKDVSIDKSGHTSLINEAVSSRSFPYIFHSKKVAGIHKSEKDLKSICAKLCINLQDILAEKTLFPWPHPKNVRYLSEYRKIRTLPDGRLQAISKDYIKKSKKRRKKILSRIEESVSDKPALISNSLTDDIDNNEKEREAFDNKVKISTSIEEAKEEPPINFDAAETRRKQKRKRGPKKKIKSNKNTPQ